MNVFELKNINYKRLKIFNGRHVQYLGSGEILMNQPYAVVFFEKRSGFMKTEFEACHEERVVRMEIAGVFRSFCYKLGSSGNCWYFVVGAKRSVTFFIIITICYSFITLQC